MVDGSQGCMSSIPHFIFIYLSTRWRLLQFGGGDQCHFQTWEQVIPFTSDPSPMLLCACLYLPVTQVQCCYVPVCIYQWPKSNAVMCLPVFTSDPSPMLLCACLYLSALRPETAWCVINGYQWMLSCACAKDNVDLALLFCLNHDCKLYNDAFHIFVLQPRWLSGLMRIVVSTRCDCSSIIVSWETGIESWSGQ